MTSYSKQFVLDFAEYYTGSEAPVLESFNTFLEMEEEEPDPDTKIYMEVLSMAAELCNVSMQELNSGLKYGALPTVKQLTAKILHELGHSEHFIANNLPVMRNRNTVHSQRMAANRYEAQEEGYRNVLNQLREAFGNDEVVTLNNFNKI